MNTIANKLAVSLDYSNMSGMAERGMVPQQSRILGLGATMAMLGQEMAFYRQDIFWTNIATKYDDIDILPYVDQEPERNIEYRTCILPNIGDALADKEFDRIYATYEDLSHLSETSLRKIGNALVRSLDDGGIIRIADIAEHQMFINDSSFYRTKNIMSYVAPSRVVVNKSP